MMNKKISFILILSVCLTFNTNYAAAYTRAVVESCSGCSLNRLPDVKKFIFQDLPDYNNVEFKHIAGAKPELVLYDNDLEIERLELSKLTRDECNDLLVTKGFKRKVNARDEI
ncbi:selenoprotein M-like [Microplitis mediator]|uniref:selenoprotein M-like n=1 Tax=Microplitis mediator TaxID=375433 RepID=UPI0025552E00|nr:selenoprotein M-like [Microplitis mediator]